MAERAPRTGKKPRDQSNSSDNSWEPHWPLLSYRTQRLIANGRRRLFETLLQARPEVQTDYKIKPSACLAGSSETGVSHKHTPVFLLVNMFIIVFPFEFIQDKKGKQKQWSRKECTILVASTDSSRSGNCALGFSSK